jgi:hypothetical protein
VGNVGETRAGRCVRASLFGNVFGEDGRWVADHLWVRQTWEHLRPGDLVEFFARRSARLPTA